MPHTRGKRGAVSVSARAGMLRLRWRWQGTQYQLALGMADTSENRQAAHGKAAEIQADIIYGRFDGDLGRYRPAPVAPPVQPPPSTVELWERFTAHRRQEGTSGQAIAARYNPLRSHLRRFGEDITTTDQARALVAILRGRQSPLVANQSLTLLKAFGRWAVEHGHLGESPWAAIAPLKAAPPPNNRRPFTREEVAIILETIRSNPRLCHYFDFCLTLFSLGLRPSEAIGLRWCHLDLVKGEVTIRETLSRAADGRSAGYARERRPTKNRSVRVLPLPPRLVAMFEARKAAIAHPRPVDLVFTTPTHRAIDDHNFRERVWKVALECAGIEYRPPYTSRHTLLSHGIEYQGWTLPQAAAIAGHTTTRMVAAVYGHAIQRPTLPEF